MSAGTDQSLVDAKREELMGHLHRAGLLGPDADTGDVLALRVQQALERRLQTLVFRLGLARSPKQARQLITHGHIAIAGRKISIPGYRVTRKEETEIGYYGTSPLKNDNHAERARITKAAVK
jgi:small subunit ribosomal protein S4